VNIHSALISARQTGSPVLDLAF